MPDILQLILLCGLWAARSSTRRSEASSLISLCVHIRRINPYYMVYNSFPFSSKCNMCLRSVGIMVIASIKLLIFMNDVLIFHSGDDSPLMLTNCSGPGPYWHERYMQTPVGSSSHWEPQHSVNRKHLYRDAQTLAQTLTNTCACTLKDAWNIYILWHSNKDHTTMVDLHVDPVYPHHIQLYKC